VNGLVVVWLNMCVFGVGGGFRPRDWASEKKVLSWGLMRGLDTHAYF
jgi:hypothetical protein